MKNFTKIIGIIAVVAVIGGIVACTIDTIEIEKQVLVPVPEIEQIEKEVVVKETEIVKIPIPWVVGALGSKTAYYSEVGLENHNYYPYAIATVTDGAIAALEMGEVFSPSGKLVVEPAGNAYRNAWYPGLAGLATSHSTHAAAEAIAAADRHYISIAGQVYVLSVWNGNFNAGNVRTTNPLIFRTVGTVASAQWLTDRYIADNIKWYYDAIKAGTVFACDQSGVKRTGTAVTIGGATFNFDVPPGNNAAFMKNDPTSDYYPPRGLSGPPFKKAMEMIADHIVTNNGIIEFEKAAGGNWNGDRIKNFNFHSLQNDSVLFDGVTQASSQNDQYLNYAASYAEVAIKAIQMAGGNAYILR